MTIAANFIAFFAIVALNIWLMWRRGEITGLAPETPRERRRLVWVVIGAANFLLFVLHAFAKGTCAFPSGGRLVDGTYLVPSHGRLIPFSPLEYALSYAHGVVFVVVTVACMIAIARLRKQENHKSPNNGLNPTVDPRERGSTSG